MESIKSQYFSLIEAVVRQNAASSFSGTIQDVTVWETTEQGEPAAVQTLFSVCEKQNHMVSLFA